VRAVADGRDAAESILQFLGRRHEGGPA
jgi:hypothetical protein